MSEPKDGAIPVHLSNPEDMIFRTEEHEPEHFSFQTYVAQPGAGGGAVGTGGQGSAQMLLGLDPLRKSASINSADAPIVLCDSAQQASRPANQVAGFPFPDGAYVAQGQPVNLSGTAAVYVACQAQTRITVIQNRRSPE
jgi:hypothetical protein